jgi:hypothetical protein
MTSTRVLLRIVALFYLVAAALKVIVMVTMRTMASQAQSGSLAHYAALRAARSFPLTAATAVGLFALSVLALRFLVLSRSWRIAAIAVSLFISLLEIANATRKTLIVAPTYLKLGADSYGYLAVELALFWGWALAYSLCSYLLWKQLRASSNRLERSRVATSVSQGGSG